MPLKMLFSTGEIARLLGMSPATIFRAIESGRLKASTTPGGHHRVLRKDLEVFLSENSIPLSALESKKKRVLIVEDNPVELRLYQRALRGIEGVEVWGVESGYKAGYITKSFKPDLILLDIFLKDVDGCEVARLIRSDPELRFTKIVAISVAANPADLRRIKRSGVNGFIQKPVSPDELREKVEKLLT